MRVTPLWHLQSAAWLMAMLATALYAQTASPTAIPTPAETREAAKTAEAEKGAVQMEAFNVDENKVRGLNNQTLFRTDEQAPLHYNVLSREEIERMGSTNIQEVFRAIPQVTNYGFSIQKNVSMANVTGGDTLSNDSVGLRGLSNSQTVVLINGRRITGVLGLNNISSFAADVSKIPIAMIDHIEVLPMSAAAIYGGGAIGGAINVVLRKDYNTKDLTASFGTSTQGGGTEYHITYLHGMTFNQGKSNLMVTLDFNKRDAVKASDRDYIARLQQRYPANTRVVTATGVSAFEQYVIPAFASSPGTFVVTAVPSAASGTSLNIPGNTTARYALVPPGLTDAQAQALTPASFAATAGTTNTSVENSRLKNLNLYTPNKTYNWNVQFEHKIFGEKLEFFYDFSGSHSVLDERYPQSLSITMSATFPLNPFRTNVTPGFVGVPVRYVFNDPDIPLSRTHQVRDDARMTTGLKGRISDRWDWTFDFAGQYTRTFVEGFTPDNYLTSILNRPGPGEPGYTGTPLFTGGPASPTTSLSYRWTNIYNPYLNHSLNPISSSLFDKYFYANRMALNYERVGTIEGRVVGKPFDLPAGPVAFSPGFDIQFTDEQVRQFGFFGADLPNPAIYGNNPAANGLQNQNSPASMSTPAWYAELSVPIIGRNYHPIPIESLQIDGSYRSDKPNHATAASTKTASMLLGVTTWASLRASMTEGFTLLPKTSAGTAPSTVTLNQNLTLQDPLRGNVSTSTLVPTVISGGNPDIVPQFGRSFNYGVILTPRAWKGFSWTVDYWKIRQFNSIVAPSAQALLTYPNLYPAGRVVRGPLTAADQSAGYTGGPILSINTSQANVAYTTTDGFDSNLMFDIPLPDPSWGHLGILQNSTFTNSFKVRTLPQNPIINQVGASSGNSPLKWKGFVQAFWDRKAWSVALTANYTDHFSTNTTSPTPFFPTANGVDGSRIPSQILLNAQVGYKIPYQNGSHGWRNWVGGTRYSLSVLNVFDKMPPFVSDGTGFYSQYGDPRQRYVTLTIAKTL